MSCLFMGFAHQTQNKKSCCAEHVQVLAENSYIEPPYGGIKNTEQILIKKFPLRGASAGSD